MKCLSIIMQNIWMILIFRDNLLKKANSTSRIRYENEKNIFIL